MHVSEFQFNGIDFKFMVETPTDAIQKKHLEKTIFDGNELLKVTSYLKDGDSIIDIGANVGNHAVYFAKSFPNSKIVVFEPFPEAMNLLKKNVELNDCNNINVTNLGMAVSDHHDTLQMMRGGPNNLGGNKIIDKIDITTLPVHQQKFFCNVKVVPADAYVLEHSPDFIKIDVEGHEMNVLAGLKATIAKFRPKIFVEVNKGNDGQFKDWLSANNYRVEWLDTKYASAFNYLIFPNT